MNVFVLALDQLHKADVDGRTHHHDLDAAFLVKANGVGLTVLVLGIEHLVLMRVLCLVQVFSQGLVFALAGLVDNRVLHAVVELVVAHAAILNKRMNVLPVGLVLLALVLEHAGQAIGDLAGDVVGKLANVAVVLQERTGDVQRQVGAIDDALEQQQKLRDDLLDVIGNEHLIGVELDLALIRNLVLQAREVQNAVQVERIIRVEVNPEQRLAPLMEGVAVELLIVLVRAVLRRAHIERIGRIEHFGNFFLVFMLMVVAAFAVFLMLVVVAAFTAVLVIVLMLFLVLGHLAVDGRGHEGAILADG